MESGSLDELRAEIARLQAENERLSREAKGVATANVRAALHLVELSEQRRQESEARQEELSAALEAASVAARKKDEFLAKVSHELRTPLNGVVGLTTLLLDSGLDEDQRGFAVGALHSAHSLSELIEDLLDLSKLEADKLRIDEGDCDLWVAVEEVVQLFAARNADPAVRLLADVAPDVPRRVVGDARRLRQVLSNLVGNAMKFTDAGHVVARVTRGGSETDPRIVCEVEDTGCGMPEGSGQEIFESFRQLDGSPRRRHGGSGLGLAISKGLVELMGGTIGVRSEVGRGSTFRFEIPLRPAADQPAAVRLDGCTVALAAARGRVAMLERQLAALGARVEVWEDPLELRAALDTVGTARKDLRYLVVDSGSFPENAAGDLLEAASGRPELSGRVLELLPIELSTSARPVHRRPSLRTPLAMTKLLDWLAGGTADEDASNALGRARENLGLDARDRPPRVLVAEDNAVNQKVTCRILEKLGCAVDLASNGREAEERVRDGDYDLVLMDCQMPEVDGFEATAAIRAREGREDGESRAGRRTRIAALTANATRRDAELCRACGMDDFLAKPIRLPELVEVLRRALEDSEPDESEATAA